MAVELASAYVSLVPSFRGGAAALQKEASNAGQTVSKGMSDEISKAGGSGGSIFRAFAGIAVAAGGIFAGAKIFKGFIDEATEAQVTSAKTAAVLKSTGGVAKVSAKDVDTLANSLSLKAGVDDELIASGANVLLTFTKVRNEAGKGNDIFNQGTSIALDMSKALGTDLQGSVIQVGKALNDPIKGITALQRVGVSFTADQKKQIKALADSGDQLGAQKLILKELNTEFGGAAAASATSGQKLEVAWKNVQETLGGLLLPVLSKVADWLTGILPKAADIATTVIGDVVGGIQDAIGYFADGFTDMGTNEGKGIFLFFNHLGMWAKDAWDGIKVAMHGIATAFDYFRGGFTGEWTGEGSGVLYFLNNLGTAAGNAWDWIKKTIPKIRDAIITGLTAAWDWLRDTWQKVSDALSAPLATVWAWIQDKWPTVRDAVLGALQAIAQWVSDHWRDVGTDLKAAFDGLKTAVKWVIDNQPVLIGVLTAIGVGLGTVAVGYVAAGAAAVASGIAAAVAWIAAAAVPIAIALAIGALAAGFVWLYQNVDAFRTVADAVAKAAVASFEWLRDNWRQIYDDIATVTVNTWNVIFNIVSTAVGIVTGIVKAFISAYQFIWDNFGNEIVATIQNAWNTISGVVQAAINIVRGIIQTVVALIHGDWSGAWDGIKQTLSGVWDAIKVLVQSALNTLQTGISVGVSFLKIAWAPIADLFSYLNDHVITPIKGAVDGLLSWMVRAFDTGVSLIGAVWDRIKEVVKAPINIVIGFYNNGIAALWNFVADAVNLKQLELPPVHALNSGGKVPGSGNQDTVPAMLTPGEFVIRKDIAEQPGMKKVLTALNAGGSIDPAILGYAGGGTVRSAAEVQAFAQQQVGKPYVFPLSGPNGYDCSGLWSAIVNYALGAVMPYTRRFSSGTIGSDRALQAGLGDPAQGLSIGAKPPFMTNSSGDLVGHVGGTIAGQNFEATPPAVRGPGAARGASNGLFTQQFNLPNFGGPNPDEQGMIATLKALMSLKLPGLGGGIGTLLSKLFVQLPKMAFDFLATKVPQIVKDAIVDVGVGIGPSANPLGTAAGLIKSVFSLFGDGGRITGPAIVGDRGPEILWNSEGQYVESLTRGGGRGGYQFYGDIYTQDPQAFFDEAERRQWRADKAAMTAASRAAA
jgi:phage-related protein